MAEESRRIRLLFKDKDGILSPSQKSEGLKRCWLLLKPQFHCTIADFSAHILDSFRLQPSCPHGLLLYIDGFSLPPFESTEILNEREIVSVRKKEVILSLEGNNATTALNVQEMRNEIGQIGTLLLANEEFETESGGYQSDEPDDSSKEVDVEEESNKYQQENQQESLKNGGNATSTKRKAVDKLQGSKKKKLRSVTTRQSEKSDQDNVQKSADEIQKNGNEEREGSAGAQKKSSRSARRKRMKRQWIREMKKIQKQSEVSQSQGHDWKRPKKSEKKNKNNWREKPAKPDEKEEDGEAKGLLHWKQWSGKNNLDHKRRDAKQNGGIYEHANRKSNLEDEVVPVVTKPGHIRFECSDKDHAEQQSQQPGERIQFSGFTSKRKVQKWANEKPWSSKRKDDEDIAKARAELWSLQNELRFNEPINFEKLPPLCDLPKVGDVIGYRLIELSSSWTPELSPYQVGLVAWCSESGKLLLKRFTECPSTPKKSTENESDPQPVYSLYKADGPLEIDFKSLIDVRIVKDDLRGVAAAIDGASGGSMDQPVSPSLPASNEKGRNLWEQCSEALSDKKAQLSQENSWGKATSSNRSSSSYRALQGGVLGPTMDLLRSKNYF